MQASNQHIAETVWSRPSGGELCWESWDDQHAVFDSLSGETHLLHDLTARILRNLDERGNTPGELAGAICLELGEPCDAVFGEDIARLMQQLESVGLVEKSAR